MLALASPFSLVINSTSSVRDALRRNKYQAWQDEVRGMQKIVRDGVETNIQVLDAGEVRLFVSHLPHYSRLSTISIR